MKMNEVTKTSIGQRIGLSKSSGKRSVLQRRLVSSFIGPQRMPLAWIARQIGKAGVAGATMFTGVFGFFAAFKQDVLAFAGAIGALIDERSGVCKSDHKGGK